METELVIQPLLLALMLHPNFIPYFALHGGLRVALSLRRQRPDRLVPDQRYWLHLPLLLVPVQRYDFVLVLDYLRLLHDNRRVHLRRLHVQVLLRAPPFLLFLLSSLFHPPLRLHHLSRYVDLFQGFIENILLVLVDLCAYLESWFRFLEEHFLLAFIYIFLFCSLLGIVLLSFLLFFLWLLLYLSFIFCFDFILRLFVLLDFQILLALIVGFLLLLLAVLNLLD